MVWLAFCCKPINIVVANFFLHYCYCLLAVTLSYFKFVVVVMILCPLVPTVLYVVCAVGQTNNDARSLSPPRRLMKLSIELPPLSREEYQNLKSRMRQFFLYEMDVSHPMFRKWLRFGCHPKFENFKKLDDKHPVKQGRADKKNHPLYPPEDITDWVWESPTRLIDEWYDDQKWSREMEQCFKEAERERERKKGIARRL